MAEHTAIEWATHTWSPWVGCTRVSPACDHCYAETMARRFGNAHLWQGERRRTGESTWREPLKWNRRAKKERKRRRVFCASMADVFDNQVPAEWRADLFGLIVDTPHLDWLLLTKRPQNIAKMLPPAWGDGWPNVWLGTTAEDAHHYRQRWTHLAAVPARLRFLSYEPALGPIGDLDLGRVGSPEWIIVGGESGPGARPMHPAWARDVRNQCARAKVPFFFKQWGEWAPAPGVDVYCHGENRNRRQFPDAEGIAWFADGRVCMRDFSVAGHRRRIAKGIAFNTRAIEVDQQALRDFYASMNDEDRTSDNPFGYQWMYRVGKRRAGAALDGREWREFPCG